MFSFYSYIYLAVELLDHMIVLLLAFWEAHSVFHSGCTNLHSPNSIQEFLFKKLKKSSKLGKKEVYVLFVNNMIFYIENLMENTSKLPKLTSDFYKFAR